MTLVDLIKTHGDILTKKAPWLDGRACLAAIAEVETAFGQYNVPKYEKAFDLGGKYGNRRLWTKFGAMAACSWSSWQIMYIVCVELGYPGRPIDLQDDSVAIHWVMDYLDKRILQAGCSSVVELFDAWNTGSFKDANVPDKYVQECLHAYATVKERRGL